MIDYSRIKKLSENCFTNVPCSNCGKLITRKIYKSSLTDEEDIFCGHKCSAEYKRVKREYDKDNSKARFQFEVTVDETMGKCSMCGEYNLLGDGVCINCWDEHAHNVLENMLKPTCTRCGKKIPVHDDGNRISETVLCLQCAKETIDVSSLRCPKCGSMGLVIWSLNKGKVLYHCNRCNKNVINLG